jgi:hypothetical protein
MRNGRFAAAEQELGGTGQRLRLDFVLILVPLTLHQAVAGFENADLCQTPDTDWKPVPRTWPQHKAGSMRQLSQPALQPQGKKIILSVYLPM